MRSMVVTRQNLAPLDEIERLRTEFLGLVSYKLRAGLDPAGSPVGWTAVAAGVVPLWLPEPARPELTAHL